MKAMESIAVGFSIVGAVAAAPQSQNPVVIASYAAGIILSLPVLVLVFRAGAFFASVTRTVRESGETLKQVRALLERQTKIETWILTQDPQAPVGPGE